ncbi:hypothetical protein Dcar01_02250 [Deinococcus carri]|uniref:PDZ domain-containing protein n=1 Tax=Deinococcus carri TaxID=1211323 RepID=A0ABP9W840_9DEIO
MNAVWMAAARRLSVALALLLSAGPALAQTTVHAPIPQPAKRQTVAPSTLSESEAAALDALYRKLRPATLRLEGCPPNDCSDPDGVGTGFLIGNGYALTAYHVVYAAGTLSAQTLDRKRYAVEVVGYDDQADLALLRVNVPAGTPFLPLAASRPAVGDPALAIGNGDGAFLMPKTGRLLSLDHAADNAELPPGTLELSAQLIPGDSGGPIINARGEVIGVVSYGAFSPSQRSIAYAVPVTQADPRLADLRQGVKRDAPIIGISLVNELSPVTALPAELFAEFTQTFNLDLGTTPGAFFTGVAPNSPAAQAGLQPLKTTADGQRATGDVVTAVNGQRVFNFSDFQFAVRRYQPGQTITLSVVRGGKPLELRLTLAARPQFRR